MKKHETKAMWDDERHVNSSVRTME